MEKFINKLAFNPTKILWIGRGCTKISPACQNCFIKQFDTFILDTNWKRPVISKRYPSGTNFLSSLSTDLFYEKLDYMRDEYWALVKSHPEYIFTIITKRVERISNCLPKDWGAGYNNVIIMLTVENQEMVNKRIPIFEKIIAKHKGLCCTPLLERVNLEPFLTRYHYDLVECAGEKGNFTQIRELDIKWVQYLSEQCKRTNTRFVFIQGGHKLKTFDGSYLQDRTGCYHSLICQNFNLDNNIPIKFLLSNKEVIK